MLRMLVRAIIVMQRSVAIKKKLVILGAAATIGLAGLGSAGLAVAETGEDGSSLVAKIAQKFNLNQDEVQAVFDEERAEHHAERETKFKERLAQAVTDGKLTQEQADKIQAKHEEMQTVMESLQDKSKDERREAMHANRDELKQWAEDNDIPEEYLRMGGRGGPGGPGGPRGEKPVDAPSEE